MASKSAYCLKEIEEEAIKILPRNALGYYQSGADHMVTLKANRSSFLKYKLMPRMMIDVSKRSLNTMALGSKVSMPVGM